MAHTFVQLAAKPVDPNRPLRTARNIAYAEEIWYFIACVIFMVSSWHLVSRLWSLIQKRSNLKRLSSEQQVSDACSSEGPRTPRLATSVALRRLHLAVTTAFKIVVFRSTLTLGSLFAANLAEIAGITGYLIAALVWEFINSKHAFRSVDRWTLTLRVISSERDNAPKFRHRILG
jgi:ferric-chelate reductase